MLPEWDFGGDDAKRRSFIAWVNAELDRIAVLTSERFHLQLDHTEWTLEMLQKLQQDQHLVGRPEETDAKRARRGKGAEIWEYALIRWLFQRTWPNRQRPVSDPASAPSIAISRHRKALRNIERTPSRIEAFEAQSRDDAAAVLKEYYRSGINSPGRRMAADDIAFLDTLPDFLFSR